MTPAQLFEAFSRLRPGSRNGHKTRHKPLLVLLALARWEKGDHGPIPFKDIETKLENLIRAYSPEAVGYPEIPFWRLRHDDVWELSGTDHLARPNSVVPPGVEELRKGVAGRFTKEVRDALESDQTLCRRLAVAILEKNFPAEKHAAIAADIGIDLSGLLHGSPSDNTLDCPLPEEAPEGTTLVEGAVRTVLVNAYERNPEARRRCIAHHGTSCFVCGFSFGERYGPVAEGYIHVHHLRPLSEVGGEYEVDPVEDLRPVCPNCHAVIHIDGGSRSIEEVKALLRPDPPQ